MTVGFYVRGALPPWMDFFANSVKRVMPGVRLVQLTDLATDAAHGVDDVVRLEAPPHEGFSAAHRAGLFARQTGDWLFLDTDVVVQHDVAHVFDHPFDIAVADRNWPLTARGQFRAGGDPDFVARMPYNAGVMFSRCPTFWHRVLARVVRDPRLMNHWYGDQGLMCELAQSGEFRVRELPGALYNFPPESLDEPDVAAAHLLHFKGPIRKRLLRDLVAQSEAWA